MYRVAQNGAVNLAGAQRDRGAHAPRWAGTTGSGKAAHLVIASPLTPRQVLLVAVAIKLFRLM